MNRFESSWRLLPFLSAPGRLQMAIDRWLLLQHSLGHPASLRFYTWSPPAISLGYNQSTYPSHWQNLTWQGAAVDLVRRPTGGRAVLHQGDLTYALVTTETGNRLQVYQKISEFLIRGWHSLGVELHYGKTLRGYIHHPSCFGTATGADLVLSNGVKLIGSAQKRQGKLILQHGSIYLEPDPAFYRLVFGTPASLPQLPLAQTGEALRKIVIDALLMAAANYFQVKLTLEPLNQSEWNSILALSNSLSPNIN